MMGMSIGLARVQVTSYGHSVSTHGAEIDYFIAGEDVEDPNPGVVASQYSERVVLIPGLGIRAGLADLPIECPTIYNDVLSVQVTAEGLFRPLITFRKQPSGDERLIVNCPWAAHKITRRHLLLLSRLGAKSKRK